MSQRSRKGKIHAVRAGWPSLWLPRYSRLVVFMQQLVHSKRALLELQRLRPPHNLLSPFLLCPHLPVSTLRRGRRVVTSMRSSVRPLAARRTLRELPIRRVLRSSLQPRGNWFSVSPSAPSLAASDLSTCLADGPGTAACPQVLLWSPDGTKLAVSLVSVDAKGDPLAAAALIVYADGSGGFVLRGSVASAGLAPPATAYTVFDVTDRSSKNVVTPAGLGAEDVIRWAPDGTLALHTGDITPAIGNPTAGTAFAPWQPGFLTSAAAGVADFGAVFGAWSPDGRYVALNLVTHVQIPASMPPATPETSLPVVVRAPRDLALQEVIHEAAEQPAGVASVAWSMTGKYFLEMQCTGVRAASLSVRSAATGEIVVAAQLTFGNTTVACAQSSVVVTWSPGDNSILLVATASGTFARWTPKLG